VIVVRGPQTDMTVRRKQRIMGIWVNREQIEFTGFPAIIFWRARVRSTTSPRCPRCSDSVWVRANLESTYKGNMDTDRAAAFRAAAVRDPQTRTPLLGKSNRCRIPEPHALRARIAVPASVPPGEYRAEAYLFEDGTVVSAQSSPLFIDKSGFERRVYNYAYQASFAYGFAAVLMAFALGWAGFVVFRQR
jgi:uncharacterized protein (TIGR02186 family)